VGPRPLADPTACRRHIVIRVALALLLLTAASAAALDVDLEPYRQARRSGALGGVSGRVLAEPSKPNAPPRPFVGTTVTLLPRSAGLLGKLENLKQGSRDSSRAFAEAAPAMRKAREAYERELLEAGAPDLNPLVLVDPDGTFRIDDVPAGTWLVIAWHSVATDVASARVNPKERQLFQAPYRLRGFQAVTVWLREVNVVGGQTATIELTDRNQWFRGVVEDRVLDAVGR
jgi:hypothetical protein